MTVAGPGGYRCPDCKQMVTPPKPTCKCEFVVINPFKGAKK